MGSRLTEGRQFESWSKSTNLTFTLNFEIRYSKRLLGDLNHNSPILPHVHPKTISGHRIPIGDEEKKTLLGTVVFLTLVGPRRRPLADKR